MSLKNKLALVTGGGSGIGAAVCKLFSEEGARVIIADVDKDGCEKVMRQLTGDSASHLLCPTDLSVASQVDSLAASILSHYRGEAPSTVVHCAGIVRQFDGIRGCTEEIWDKVINVNLKGTYLINRKFILLMQEQKIRGSVVNISSISRFGLSSCPEYSTSKAGQIGLTLSLSKEFAGQGIRVNAIAPGSIETPFVDNSGAKTDETEDKTSRANLPMGRNGTAQEVAEVCLFLASDKSSYVTGSVYEVHGGLNQNK